MHTANTIQQGVCRNNGNNYTAVPPLATTNYLLLTIMYTFVKIGGVYTVGQGWSGTARWGRLTISNISCRDYRGYRRH